MRWRDTRWAFSFARLASLALAFDGRPQGVAPRAKSPEASRASIRVRSGFQVELVAREPLVNDPIAFEWGADGLTADFHGTVHDPRDVNDILDRRVVEHPCLYDMFPTRK
jgi:hypothetical protein